MASHRHITKNALIMVLVLLMAMFAVLPGPELARAWPLGDVFASVFHNSKQGSGAITMIPELGKSPQPRLSEPTAYESTASSDQKECGQCVHGVAVHIIDSTMDSIQQWCANTTCPFLKRKCHFVEDHRELVEGYIAAKIRPVQSGFFYCAGTGKCDPHYDPHHRNVTAALFAVENSDVLMAEAFGKKIQQHADSSVFGLGSGNPAEHCLETEDESTESKNDDAVSSSVVERIFGFNANKKDDDDMGVIASLQNLWSDSSDSDAENNDYDTGSHRKHNCVSCYKKSVKKYMKRVVGRVMRFCEHSKCPFVQKVCKWAEEHKEFSLGYLLGATKPFAFSAGYCMGEGECRRFHDTGRSEMLHDLFGMEPEVRQPRMGQLVFTSVESLVNDWL